MRLNRNVQCQYRFTIGLFSDMQFVNHNSTSKITITTTFELFNINMIITLV